LLAVVVEDPGRNTHAALIAAALALPRPSSDPAKER